MVGRLVVVAAACAVALALNWAVISLSSARAEHSLVGVLLLLGAVVTSTHLRNTIEAVVDEELDAFLARVKYTRVQGEGKDYRRGQRERQLTSTLVTEAVSVPRARLQDRSGHSSQ